VLESLNRASGIVPGLWITYMKAEHVRKLVVKTQHHSSAGAEEERAKWAGDTSKTAQVIIWDLVCFLTVLSGRSPEALLAA
jgi:hypothetical protein